MGEDFHYVQIYLLAKSTNRISALNCHAKSSLLLFLMFSLIPNIYQNEPPMGGSLRIL